MESASLSAIRGKIYDLQLSTVELKKPVKILATFHPAALLRNPGWKKDAWADLKVLLAAIGRAPAQKQ
jgi:DNA polymerase